MYNINTIDISNSLCAVPSSKYKYIIPNNTCAIGVNICPNKTSGLCNQLFRLISAIQVALSNKIPILFIGKFYKNINSADSAKDSYCNVSDIIDMEKLNKLVFDEHQLALVDINNFIFNIKKISYGINELNVDITNEILCNYFINNRLVIPKDYDFSYFYKIIKKINTNLILENMVLYFLIEINGMDVCYNHKFKDITDKKDIIIDFSTIEFSCFGIYDQNIFFVNTIRNIKFRNNILNKADDYINKVIKLNDKLNCIHLRLEDDAMIHWSKENNMNKDDYKKLVEFNYIKMIKENIDKNISTIILGHDYNNAVIDYMKQNNYKFILTPKFSKQREISAIIDMHIGEQCTHKYIFIFESSFSFTLLCRVKNKENFHAIMMEFNKLTK